MKETRSDEQLELDDHSAKASLARTLLDVLVSMNRPLTPLVAAALSDKAIREKLAAALLKSEAARRPFDKAWERVTAELFDSDAEVSTSVVMNKLPLAELKKWTAARRPTRRLDGWTRSAKVEAEAAFRNHPVLDEVKAGGCPGRAADAFRAVLPALARFSTSKFQRSAFATDSQALIGRFVELDRLAIRTAADRVRSQLLSDLTRPQVRDGALKSVELQDPPAR